MLFLSRPNIAEKFSKGVFLNEFLGTWIERNFAFWNFSNVLWLFKK